MSPGAKYYQGQERRLGSQGVEVVRRGEGAVSTGDAQSRDLKEVEKCPGGQYSPFVSDTLAKVCNSLFLILSWY